MKRICLNKLKSAGSAELDPAYVKAILLWCFDAFL